MEDFRLFYAAGTKPAEQADKLPPKLQERVEKENVPSVRPHIPAELEYVGTVVEGQICFDYHLLPDGQLRQEYRRPEQDIILSYRDEESLQHIPQRERKKRAAIAEPPSENVV